MGWLVNNVLEMTGKKVVVEQLKVVYWNLPGKFKNLYKIPSHVIPYLGREHNFGFSRYAAAL
jgi:hypothetical protein